MSRATGSLLRAALDRATVLRAVRVTAVVAPTLIVINHAACVIEGRLRWMCLFQALLTTVVPYVVSSYSSASATLQRERATTEK